MQHHDQKGGPDALTQPLNHGWQDVLAPSENVRAAFEVDLDADLRFAPGSLALTDTRLLARDGQG